MSQISDFLRTLADEVDAGKLDVPEIQTQYGYARWHEMGDAMWSHANDGEMEMRFTLRTRDPAAAKAFGEKLSGMSQYVVLDWNRL